MVSEYERHGKQRSRNAIANFLRYAAEAISLIQLTQDGTQVLIRIRDQLNALDIPPSSAAEDRNQKSIEERAHVAEQEVKKDFPLLNAHALVGLWGALESCVDDVAEGWIASDQGRTAKESIGGLRVQLSEILYLETNERWRWVVDQIKRNQGSALKSGVGQFESLLSAVGFGGEVDPHVRTSLFYVKAVRNLLAHKAGRVDERFIDSFPDAGLRAGQQLRVNTRQVFAATFAMIHYVESLAEREALSPPDRTRPEWVPTPRQVLDDFSTIFYSAKSDSFEG